MLAAKNLDERHPSPRTKMSAKALMRGGAHAIIGALTPAVHRRRHRQSEWVRESGRESGRGRKKKREAGLLDLAGGLHAPVARRETLGS